MSRPPMRSTAVHEPIERDLAQLAMPVLLLWADADAISPLAVGQRLDGLLLHSELVVYESTDHWVVLEHAIDVARRITGLATA